LGHSHRELVRYRATRPGTAAGRADSGRTAGLAGAANRARCAIFQAARAVLALNESKPLPESRVSPRLEEQFGGNGLSAVRPGSPVVRRDVLPQSAAPELRVASDLRRRAEGHDLGQIGAHESGADLEKAREFVGKLTDSVSGLREIGVDRWCARTSNEQRRTTWKRRASLCRLPS